MTEHNTDSPDARRAAFADQSSLDQLMAVIGDQLAKEHGAEKVAESMMVAATAGMLAVHGPEGTCARLAAIQKTLGPAVEAKRLRDQAGRPTTH